MIEKTVKIVRFSAEILGKHLGVENSPKPLEADQSVYRRR